MNSKSKSYLIVIMMVIAVIMFACLIPGRKAGETSSRKADQIPSRKAGEDHPDMLMALEIWDISFGQVDWYRLDGSLAQADSLYGWLSWTYDPDPALIFYLNLFVSLEEKGDGSWVIQNLPLFPYDDEKLLDYGEAAYFNLAELGLEPGTDLSRIYYALSVDQEIRTTPPGPAELAADVETLKHLAGDSVDETPATGTFTDPGAPIGIKLDGVPQKVNKNRDVGGVQEGVARCCVGAFARSIDWLNRKYSLGVDKTAQQMYDDLLAAGVSVPNADRTSARDEWISIKNQYVKTETGGRIVTKVWDPDKYVDPIEGVTEESGDFLTWFNKEIKTEDVEIAYYYEGGAHIVTGLQVYTQKGKTFVKYRDDEHQGDDSAGDTKVKHAQIIKKGDKYHFLSESRTIYFAVSESYQPPPPTPTVAPKDWQVFAVLLTGDYQHFQGSSEVRGDVVVLGQDPVPVQNAEVTIQMSHPDGSSETMTAITDQAGIASYAFTIYVYGNYPVKVEDIKAEGMVYSPELNVAEEILVNVGPGEGVPQLSASGLEKFYELFNGYFQAQDVEGLLSLLNENVIMLYGEDACRAYLSDVVKEPLQIKVLEVKDFGTWNWEIDDKTTMVEHVYTITGDVTAAGQTNTREIHLGLRSDATLGWFTDCGTPLPAQ